MKRVLLCSQIILGAFLLCLPISGFSQIASLTSPNQKVQVALHQPPSGVGKWYLQIRYSDNGKVSEALPRVELGLLRSDQQFADSLNFTGAGKVVSVKESYTALHGKRSVCSNEANEMVISFETPSKARMQLILRAYNDGAAFRYLFPEKSGSYVMNDEYTSYTIPGGTKRWLERWNPANEGLYQMSAKGAPGQEWCYPALFQTADEGCWFLLHEADLDRTYCGTKLSNRADTTAYKLTFPDPRDARGKGEALPRITLPWKSPWRVVVLGSLATLVESTLIDDISTPSAMQETEWIQPGKASWNYWSQNHGTKDFRVVCEFADLAARMDWPYTLLDWEWDAMGNGGKLEDALAYIRSMGIKPLMWYNSGGDHTWVASTPKDRMLTHENRVAEFTKLQQLGVYGVKIDFFESEKQDMISYYLDILDDAATYKMMVYFHGCLVPRGWARTYPHLMTYEGVRGAEWYNNGPELTLAAPEHNTILPFTRNVVGAMDYTPVTFTNSQYPHVTSYAHELALSVLFESGMQHLADRPEGYDRLPDEPKKFLREVPASWDDTKFIDGYPGKEVILARRKGDAWYLGGVNAELREKRKRISFSFLPKGVPYRLTLIADGVHDTAFATEYQVVTSESTVPVRMLRRGGFAASLIPVK